MTRPRARGLPLWQPSVSTRSQSISTSSGLGAGRVPDAYYTERLVPNRYPPDSLAQALRRAAPVPDQTVHAVGSHGLRARRWGAAALILVVIVVVATLGVTRSRSVDRSTQTAATYM